MSEAFTVVTRRGRDIYLTRGHVSRVEMISEARTYFEQQLEEAKEALLVLNVGLVRVYHQRGVHVVRDRREVV
jgi:hypothetical protein